jgi:hypothetical protein
VQDAANGLDPAIKSNILKLQQHAKDEAIASAEVAKYLLLPFLHFAYIYFLLQVTRKERSTGQVGRCIEQDGG